METEAPLSVICWSSVKTTVYSNFKLYAANGTKINTYPFKKDVSLKKGLRRMFTWAFVIADAILGADFLEYYELIDKVIEL